MDEVKQRKAALQSTPESVNLKNEVGELKEKVAEIEDTLNNHFQLLPTNKLDKFWHQWWGSVGLHRKSKIEKQII